MKKLSEYMGKARRMAKGPKLDLKCLEKEMDKARSKLYKEMKKGNKGELIWEWLSLILLR